MEQLLFARRDTPAPASELIQPDFFTNTNIFVLMNTKQKVSMWQLMRKKYTWEKFMRWPFTGEQLFFFFFPVFQSITTKYFHLVSITLVMSDP